MKGALMLGARIAPVERPMMIAVAEQLSECLTDPGEAGWPITLRFVAGGVAPPPIVIATLRGAIDGTEDVGRLPDHLAALAAAGAETIFLCTLLRFVADRAERPRLMPRIRRLNLLAVELSHDLGLAVIDVDRVLALFGAGPLQTDYRLGGPGAVEVAAHVIVAALLAGGLDDLVPFDRQERAIARHGDIHNIAAIVDRRLKAKAGAAKMPR